MINNTAISSALSIWSKAITQELATRLITEAFFRIPNRPSLALHPITQASGSVDYDAWRCNRINIFQRWCKCQTSMQCKKFNALIPAILAAIELQNAELHKQITAGNSIEYLVARSLKENAEVHSAALNGASLEEFERECDEAEQAVNTLRHAYRQQQQRHDH